MFYQLRRLPLVIELSAGVSLHLSLFNAKQEASNRTLVQANLHRPENLQI